MPAIFTPTRRDFLSAGAVSALGLCLGGCFESGSTADSEDETVPLDSSVEPKEPWRAEAAASISRAAEWLWAQQRKNGAFASSTYGLFRDGQSLTPFSLLALLQVSNDLYEFPILKARDAFFRMLGMLNDQGALGFWSPAAPDYPCYATGMMLTCLGILKPMEWAEASGQPVLWLRGQQFRSADGWAGHPAQGGWGLGSETKRIAPNAGHVDLSMTRAALEGLRSVGLPTDDPTLVEATHFVARCQTEDGSFFYSPVELALNKAGPGSSGAQRGYGSATADGLLCLLALGKRPTDPDLIAARSWLIQHHRVDRNPGLEGGPMEVFGEAMRGYYRAAAAECFLLAGGPQGWRSELATALAAEQRAEGYWQNSSPLQKEDDPIVSTGFAIRTLAALLR